MLSLMTGISNIRLENNPRRLFTKCDTDILLKISNGRMSLVKFHFGI